LETLWTPWPNTLRLSMLRLSNSAKRTNSPLVISLMSMPSMNSKSGNHFQSIAADQFWVRG